MRPDTLARLIDARAAGTPVALLTHLAEVRRVTQGPIVVLTSDPDRVPDFWLAEYAPEVTAAEAGRYPPVGRIAAALAGDTVTTTPLPLPRTRGSGGEGGR